MVPLTQLERWPCEPKFVPYRQVPLRPVRLDSTASERVPAEAQSPHF